MFKRLLLVASLLLGCEPGYHPGEVDGMTTTVTVRARGLYTQPGPIGSAPDGALLQADNVVITADGTTETRRGTEILATKTMTKLIPWDGILVGHNRATGLLSHSDATGVTWADYTGTYLPPTQEQFRAAALGHNLYFTTAGAPYRLDSDTGTPEVEGVPDALDVQGVVSGAGVAVPNNTQVAYRVVFGKRDANGTLILGGPSGRSVMANTAGSTQDVSVAYSLPDGLPADAIVQAYRTYNSGGVAVDPGDEVGLIYEGGLPSERSISQLVRSANVVTATATAHGYSTGQIVKVSPGGSVGGVFCAVGASAACATSPDGTTAWTGRTIPAGDYTSVAWNGSVFAAVGASVAATSPDGVTWTSRTIPAGTYYAIAWNGTVFAAIGYGSSAATVATSPDGTTWTTRSVPNVTCYAVAWNGSVFAAVGYAGAVTSPDGITWTSRTMASGNYYGIAWSGNLFAAVGDNGSGHGVAATSPDGVTWTSRTNDAGVTWRAVAWNGTVFAAVGGSSAWSTSSDGITWTNGNMPSPSVLHVAIVWSGSLFAAVGTNDVRTSTDGASWTARSIPSGAYAALTVSGALFPAGEKVVTGTPTADTFTYAETGGNGTLVQAQTATPMNGAFVDSVPSSFIGAALYTNPSQGGIQLAASQVENAHDLAMFRETLFYANIAYPSGADVYLLAVSDGSSGGIVAGNKITIDGLDYTANASTESISNRTFKLSASSSPATRLFETAASLIRIINRTDGNSITAQDTSSATDPGPRIHLTENGTAVTISIAFTGHPTSWSVANLTGPVQNVNELRWSQPQQPDTVPILNSARVGGTDKAILRILPTRNALYILKEDGVWLLTGYGSPWQIDPFDPTIELIAPDSAVVLDNQIYCLTHHGVMRISDTGVTAVSRPIEDLINVVLTPAMRATTRTYAFGVSDEHDHKYYLWIPQVTTDTQATRAYVYDIYTDAWTSRTDPMSFGLANPADDRLYFAGGTSVRQERKTFTPADLADESYAVTISSGAGTASVVLADATNALVGDAIVQGTAYAVVAAKDGATLTLDRAAAFTNASATVYRAIATTIEWLPKFGSDPSMSYRFREATILFRDTYFAAALIAYSSDWYQPWTTIPVNGADYGWTGSAIPVTYPTETLTTPLALRSLVDVEHGRATQLYVRFAHAQALSPMRIQAMVLVFNPVSTRMNR